MDSKDRIVPWPVVKGKRVTTCGLDEEALGLSKVISGWGPEGYYVPSNIRGTQLTATAVEAVDWERFTRVQEEFFVGMGGGGMMFTDTPIHFIDRRRYQRLVAKCRKAVPVEEFEAYLAKMQAYVEQRGRGKEISTGRM